MKAVISAAAICAIAGSANAQLGRAVSENAANDNFLTEIIAVDPGYDGNAMTATWAGGDMFGITSRPTAASFPFAMGDDSNGTFTPDTQGIIDANDLGRFFGVVDTVNGQEGDGIGAARWTFATGGNSNLSVNIDMAAMGDFEDSAANNDSHVFEYSYDNGANYFPLFTSSVDTAGFALYTMAGGAVVTLDDPMSMNGTQLDNNFQTLSANTTGAGAELWIRYTGGSDGGSEAFAFRNIEVIPTPGTIALMGLAGVAGVRRRRA